MHEAHDLHEPHPHDHDRGLALDLPTMVDRRRALRLMAGAGFGLGALGLAACTSGGTGEAAGTTTAAGSGATTPTTAPTVSPSSTAQATGASCSPTVPEETAGPYPADGTNGPDVLTDTGVVRRDIRSSFDGLTGTAEGAPLTIKLKLLDAGAGCTPLAGAAVYAWHCNATGQYSLYSSGATNQNWLRGVQQADADGWVTFDSIFPGCYSGRWPHIHFEVYRDLDAARKATNALLTSQVALPQDACEAVYARSTYTTSARNLSGTSLQSDMVFRDSWQTQLATVTGDVASGLVSQLNVPFTPKGASAASKA